ncbi:MAG: hypothetical protein RIQ81_416 [Pseudomonadota bacterium]|jgi:uncharacterized protein Smg (DUF494 family)
MPKSWWDAVREIASMVVRDGLHQADEGMMRKALQAEGFSEDEILKAFDWIDHAERSGNLLECLGMLAPRPSGVRVEHPMERMFVSDRVWGEIGRARRREVVHTDLAERLLEGIRAIDTRDWEDHEVRSFIADVVSGGSGGDASKVEQILKDQLPEFYS